MISFMLSENYAFELSILHNIRAFKDGISFFELTCTLDLYKADHHPKFSLMWVLLNLKIFEMNVYNINHVKEN